MPNKESILENIDQYTAEELVSFIKNGIVTFEELCLETDGCFSVKVRKAVKEMLENSEEEEWKTAKSSGSAESLSIYLSSYPNGNHRDEARTLRKSVQSTSRSNVWEATDKNDVKELQSFIINNPTDTIHCREAKRRITALQQENNFDISVLVRKIKEIELDEKIIDSDESIFNLICECIDKKRVSYKDILEEINKDNNFLSSETIRKLVGNGDFLYDDFYEVGIDRRFVNKLKEVDSINSFDAPPKIEKISKVSTEVYFWGIPSSGKSCALGGILSVANKGTIAKSMSKDLCQGFDYMNCLAQLFDQGEEVGTLPPGTPVTSTYEMAFDLEDRRGLFHPITCIDLAGEILRCMYLSDAKLPMKDDEREALNTLERILKDERSQNRKIHFFVLEYGAEKKLYKGHTQKEYLDEALGFIKRTGIFQHDTDAIYLLITKVDKTKARGKELETILRKFIVDNYQAFYDGLKSICKKNEINDGVVDILPFSLGRVCFQNYCLFKDAPANLVVEKILQRSKGFNRGKLQQLLDKLKK